MYILLLVEGVFKKGLFSSQLNSRFSETQSSVRKQGFSMNLRQWALYLAINTIIKIYIILLYYIKIYHVILWSQS